MLQVSLLIIAILIVLLVPGGGGCLLGIPDSCVFLSGDSTSGNCSMYCFKSHCDVRLCGSSNSRLMFAPIILATQSSLSLAKGAGAS